MRESVPRVLVWAAAIGAAVFVLGCAAGRLPREPVLEEFAVSSRQWTGVGVAAGGRVFVNFPRWSDDVPVSVAELVDGRPVPFPDEAMNSWRPGDAPAARFVCVQSVVGDDEGYLWILDAANPGFRGVVEGGPKLVKTDPRTREVLRTYPLGPEAAPAGSYLNDVRVDTARGYAYLTDSGTGSLVTVELTSGRAWRVLPNHPSTKWESLTLTVGGKPWRIAGEPPRVHADGIAYDARGDWVYYQALSGRTLYRIPGPAMRDPGLSESHAAARVEKVGSFAASDGLAFGADGKTYLTAIEEDAILRVSPGGRLETVVRDPRLAWPDSLAWGPGGFLYVTTSQIHLGSTPPGPYRIYRFRPE
jgi:sugar lactone lactonase YvrE